MNCDGFGDGVGVHKEFPIAEDVNGGLVVQEDPEYVKGAAIVVLCETLPPTAVTQCILPLGQNGNARLVFVPDPSCVRVPREHVIRPAN